MAKLIYGTGVVNLTDAKNVAGIEIHYNGAFEYSSLCKNLSTKIRTSNNKIIIYTLEKNHSIEGDLFMYQGELSITNVIVGDWDAKKISTSIKRVGLALAEGLTSNAETIDILSDDLKETKVFNKTITKTKRVEKKQIKIKTLKGFPPHP